MHSSEMPVDMPMKGDDERSASFTPSVEFMHILHKQRNQPEPEAAREPNEKTLPILSRFLSLMSTKSITNPPPAPNGGLQAWTQVATGWIVMFTTWGWIVSYGAFQNYYSVTLPESASTISWIGGIQNFLTSAIGAFSGRLLDAGYFLPTILAGSALQILGIFFMSLSTKYWQLLLTQGIITGIGGGISFIPALGLMGTYFTSRRAIALGISTTGNSVGGIVYPLLIQQLLPKLGFAWTVRVIGFLNLGLLTLAVPFMRPRLPPRKSGPVIDLAAFKDTPYALYVAGFFFAIWPIYYTLYYVGHPFFSHKISLRGIVDVWGTDWHMQLAPFATQALSMPFSTSTSIVILVNAVGIPARIIPSFLADKIGQLNMVVPITASLTVIAFTWLCVDSPQGLWVFTAFYGVASAAFQGIAGSSIASLTPDMNMLGTRLGMAFTVASFGSLTGPPIGGALQAIDGSFLAPLLWAAASSAACVVFISAARVSKAGWSMKTKC